MKDRERPLGVLILGSVNFFILGWLFLILGVIAYWQFSPSDYGELIKQFKFQEMDVKITYLQFKQMLLLLNTLQTLGFIISGWGILYKKRWAPRFTTYFAFFLMVLIFFNTLTNISFFKHAFVYILYVGVLILYFTKREVIDYFHPLISKEK